MKRNFEDMDDDALERLRDQIEATQEERRRANPCLRIEEWEKTVNQVRLRIEDTGGVKTYCYASGLRLQVQGPEGVLIGVASSRPKKDDHVLWDASNVWPTRIAEGITDFKKRLTSLLARAESDVTEYKNALAKLT